MTGALSECPPSASLGNGAFGSGLDLTIYYHVCVRWVRARVDYIVMCLPCDVLIRVGVSYIYNVHVMYSAGYFAQHALERCWTSQAQPSSCYPRLSDAEFGNVLQAERQTFWPMQKHIGNTFLLIVLVHMLVFIKHLIEFAWKVQYKLRGLDSCLSYPILNYHAYLTWS